MKKKSFFLFLLILGLFLPIAVSAATVTQLITSQLTEGTITWNRGDVKTFVHQIYENSKATLYVSTKGVTKGYHAILADYLQRYPDKNKMGKLSFHNLQVKPLSDMYALVIGQCTLQRSPKNGGNVRGYFTLLYHKTAGGWKILVDHTS